MPFPLASSFTRLKVVLSHILFSSFPLPETKSLNPTLCSPSFPLQPTFVALKGGKAVDAFSGADPRKLQNMIKTHGQ